MGDTNTGKTSLVLRLVSGTYKNHGEHNATVGAFFLTKRLTVDSITCKLLLWDTAGQAQFQKLARTYYTDAAAAILAYDITQPNSLNQLRHWLEELQRNTAGRRMVIAVAACKCDLDAAAGVAEEARRIAQSVNAIYMETSAKDNVGVQQLFTETSSRILQWAAEAAQGNASPIPVTVATGGVFQQHQKQRLLHNTTTITSTNNTSSNTSSRFDTGSSRETSEIASPHNRYTQQQQNAVAPHNSSRGSRTPSSTTPVIETSRIGSKPSAGYDGSTLVGSSFARTATPETDESETMEDADHPGHDTILEAPMPSSSGGGAANDAMNATARTSSQQQSASNNNSSSSNVMCEGSLLVCGTEDKNCSIM